MRPFLDEQTSGLESDPARRAGDDADAIAEAEVHERLTITGVTTILLVRHGETDWNRESRFQGHADPPLNELGREQSRALAEQLADENLSAIYTSPLRRARETAEIVGAALGLSVEDVPGLREADVGSWSGLTIDEIRDRFPDGYRRWIDYRHGWDDGETYEEMGARVRQALVELSESNPDGRLLTVTHGGPIRAALALADRLAHSQARRQGPPLQNCTLIQLAIVRGAFRRLD